VHDAGELFERLVLEGMQAGLSWLTVLRKRDHMRERFFGFAMDQLAVVLPDVFDGWMLDPGLIRHRGKLNAMVNNARLAGSMDDFAEWLWRFAPSASPARTTMGSIPSITPESSVMSKALKKAGFSFVGPTTCYAFMQSVGMVNDHVEGCFRHEPCAHLVSEALRDASR
jgi:DNA-3-methyladenine glycosylase I